MSRVKQGFTLVEIALAVLIVSLLSLAIALVANSISTIVAKGLSVKSVNSIGASLVDELTESIASSPVASFASICDTVYTSYSNISTTAQSLCRNDDAFAFIFSDRSGEVRSIDDEPGTSPSTVQLSGVFCTGKYSYVWNTGYTLNPNNYVGTDGHPIPSATVKLPGGSTLENFRLLRFEDANREVCASRIIDITNQTHGYGQLDDSREYDFSGIEFPSAPEELLLQNDNDLALYNLYLAPPAQDDATSRTFYSGSFVLATLRGGVNVFATGDYCRLTGTTADLNYCAVNKFNFAAQALGK